jgi:hypothetical protein
LGRSPVQLRKADHAARHCQCQDEERK